MKTLNFFIIFHDKLFQENTSGFSENELETFFTWVAVNEKIPKEFPSWIPKNSLLKEYEMKQHCPLYQMLHFYQNSVFFHLYKNKELINSKYIGFGQYDMSFQSDEFRKTHGVLKDDTADKIVVAFPFPFRGLCDEDLLPNWKRMFLDPYNSFYGTNHTFENVKNLPLFLCHTFIIPTWFFLHMMPFAESILPNVMRELDWTTRHLGGTYERVFALCISFGIFEGKFRQILQLDGVSHIESQHSVDVLRGINAGCVK